VIVDFPRFVHAIRKNIFCRPYPILRAHPFKFALETNDSAAVSIGLGEMSAHASSPIACFCRLPALAGPLFSYSYESLFSQVLYFHIHLRCPGVRGGRGDPKTFNAQRGSSKPFSCHRSERRARNPSICHRSEKPGGRGTRRCFTGNSPRSLDDSVHAVDYMRPKGQTRSTITQ